jgi:ketosteroid isomerase-like protein
MTNQEQRNIEIVRAAYEGLGNGDYDRFFAAWTDETEFHEAPSLPYGGIYRGVTASRRGVAKLVFGTWEDFTFQILQFGAGGDLVFAHVIISGIGRKTGKSFSMPIVEMWRLKNGKAIEFRPFYFDTARCVECFG